MSLIRSLRALPAVAAALLVLAPVARAQACPGPDNLDGPCCDLAQLLIPNTFPGFDIQSVGICWDDCGATTNNTRFRWINVTQVSCGRYSAFTDVCTPTGIPYMSGIASLDYTRTWEEMDPVSLERTQVWRFVAKVDLSPSATVPLCPRPPCIDVFQQAFFYGYVDWALNCDTGVWRQAAMLFHNCDLFIHNGLSAQPGPSHPSSVYGIVAPNNAANPFLPAPVFPAPGGSLVAEAVRNVNAPFSPTLCVKEEGIASGSLLPLAYACLCGSATVPMQSANFLTGASACGTVFESLFFPSAWPTVPWIHLISTSIGSWTTSNSYPGPESVQASEGLLRYLEGCSGDASVEVFYGATTSGGWPIATPGSSDTFVDLVDNYSQPLPGTPSLPIVGVNAPSDHLIYVNVP